MNAESVQVDVSHGSAFVDREVLRMAVRDAEQQRTQCAQASANDQYNPKCIAQGCPNPCIRLNCATVQIVHTVKSDLHKQKKSEKDD